MLWAFPLAEREKKILPSPLPPTKLKGKKTNAP